jgi:hypothetical protein
VRTVSAKLSVRGKRCGGEPADFSLSIEGHFAFEGVFRSDREAGPPPSITRDLQSVDGVPPGFGLYSTYEISELGRADVATEEEPGPVHLFPEISPA